MRIIAQEKSDFQKVEEKWKKKWSDAGIFNTKNDKKLKKYYVLEMWPYPSGVAAHVGHARNYVIGDTFARFMRMRGFNVLYPMGWDSFGLPSENAAIALGVHPTVSIAQNIKTMKEQFNALSLSYDWSKEISTHESEYYRWNQWLFLKLYERGLAYRKFAPGNWCPSCKTILANDEVKDGKCWRCDSEVEQKQKEQWFFKITAYADRLLEGLERIEWSKKVKEMQVNWIGKSEGVDIFFRLKDSDKILSTFTTRCDTIFSVTFLAIAPESPLVEELTKGTEYEKPVRDFANKVVKEKIEDRVNEEKEKEGVFSGRYAINPATKKEIPIYVANFALLYGTGVVMCDAHDKRDFRFARKYGIPLKFVISKDGKPIYPEDYDDAMTDDGILFDSGEFNGMNNQEALPRMADWLEENNSGKKTTNYKIRDWCISRQRYWGTPIPIVYCEKCGIVPLSEKSLPLKLPHNVDFKQRVISPLVTNKDFINAKCPQCGGSAKRESDTMTTFVDSSWYFLRYPDPHNEKEIFDKDVVNYWLPADQYIGGTEHAVGHLMFSRFFTKFLYDIGFLKFDEPFLRLLNQGMVLKNGMKMSKSKGNTIDPRIIIKKHGVDVLRTYLMAMAAPEKDVEWSDRDMQGVAKILKRVESLFDNLDKAHKKQKYIRSVTQSTIKNVTENMKSLEQNKAVQDISKLTNELTLYPDRECYKKLLLLLTPFAPHICEELWEKLGEKPFISTQKWPEVDEGLIDEKVEEEEENIRKTIEDIQNIIELIKGEPKKIHLYVIPPEFSAFSESVNMFKEKFKEKEIIIHSSDKPEYDPEGKAKRAKFGKPGIYVE